MDTIGSRIKYVRTSNKRTQVQFAKELGISQTHVSKLEKGVENPSDMLLLFIAQKYNYNIEWLKKGIGEAEKEGGADVNGQIIHFKNISNDFERELYSMNTDEIWNSVDSMNYLYLIVKNLTSLKKRQKSLALLKNVSGILRRLYAISFRLSNDNGVSAFENKIFNERLATEINELLLEILKS